MKLCDLETSKALQELGYDGECHSWYSHDGKLKSTNLVDDDIPAPRLDDAAYWLREKKGLFIEINLDRRRHYDWAAIVIDFDTGYYKYMARSADYDDALENTVKKAIEIIKEQEQ